MAGVLADCMFGCLPASLKTMTVREAAQIVLWLDHWLEDVILKEVHTGIPFYQSLLFGKAVGSLVE